MRRGDLADVERAAGVSIDIAQTLEAIAQSARSGQTVTLWPDGAVPPRGVAP